MAAFQSATGQSLTVPVIYSEAGAALLIVTGCYGIDTTGAYFKPHVKCPTAMTVITDGSVTVDRY